jgi:hypothetical protein
MASHSNDSSVRLLTTCTAIGIALVGILFLLSSASIARGNIFQWEWVNPDFPLQKQASSTLCVDGAGVSGVPGANLSGRNLTKAYLTGANLTGINGSGANFTIADFQTANLTNANFSGTNLTNANLRFTTLTGANFTGAEIVGAHLGGNSAAARMTDVQL